MTDSESYESNAEGYGLTPGMMHYFMGHYVGSAADYANPYVCPVRSEDLSGLPPALIVTAEYDPPRRGRGVWAAAAGGWCAVHHLAI